MICPHHRQIESSHVESRAAGQAAGFLFQRNPRQVDKEPRPISERDPPDPPLKHRAITNTVTTPSAHTTANETRQKKIQKNKKLFH